MFYFNKIKIKKRGYGLIQKLRIVRQEQVKMCISTNSIEMVKADLLQESALEALFKVYFGYVAMHTVQENVYYSHLIFQNRN